MTESIISDMEPEFLRYLNRLVEKKPWDLVSSECSGRMLGIHCGAKVLRKRPLPQSPWITETRRLYEGEVILHFEGAWRLDCGDSIICGSCDFEDDVEKKRPDLDVLLDKQILAVDCIGIAHDLKIVLAGNLAFSTFCDMSLEPQADECSRTYYTVTTSEGYFCVERDGKIDWVPAEQYE